MNKEQYSRIEALLGTAALEKLRGSRVIVFGIGGVGGHVVEALARSGVGALDLVDKDDVSLSNLNRQIIALQSTVGRPKVEVMKERIADIDPDCMVTTHQMLYLPETSDHFDFTQYDYVVDAIDTVAAKIDLVLKAREAGVPVICSMGTGNKLDP
ncbi:MAG: ThiF family adenylyltransferase, partial [Firmicutes bacterium]|nr:ThiF family adenylyltransferase [Bacillota bacterium]